MSEASQPTLMPSATTTEGAESKTNKGTYKSKGKYGNSKKRRNDEGKRSTYVGDTPKMLGHVSKYVQNSIRRDSFKILSTN